MAEVVSIRRWVSFLLMSPFLILLLALGSIHADAAAVSGRVTVRGARDNRDAVIYIDKIPGKRFNPPSSPVVLDQLNLTFTPHVLPVLAGTTVAFPNGDEIRHNVFSPTSSSKFNLGSYPRGTTKYFVFDKPGPVTVLCNVHTEMSAYVIVTETPYFTVSDRAGNFSISDVPPGKYILNLWHEKAKPISTEIEVREGETLYLSLELKR